MNQNANPRIKVTTTVATKSTQRPSKLRPQYLSVQGGDRSAVEQPKPPDDGCWICKGAHWARVLPDVHCGTEGRDCKDATGTAWRVKHITADDEPTFWNTTINGVLDVPFCPDTGSNANIIGRPIVTAADPLALTNIECLVLDAPDEELLLGRGTLQSIGVDLDGIFEQLHVVEADAQADDIPVLGSSAENDVVDVLHRLVDEATEAGFDMHSAGRLRDLVVSYSDVFRLRLDHDKPADVEPLEVRLVPDAQPYRSGRQFLRDYVRELEPARLVERNNHSRWSCPALPVAKQGTNEFWITIDYRPVTIPLAGAASNLAVVVEAVRGAYGFGTYDFRKGFWQMPLHSKSR
ncbi:LOW QUALITY PROTEIN: hypothetical protein PHMEG_00030049 [Phytophthora megakarya]|uniref:Reverse transcriptase n=1 Tax=Phytophthora megakarya TaxID=4795 RepID=A0A225UZR7_9STRA|nr:LOW QUALITY PROTEIN: hypothetical protein PHMEG_00030049 [Phytophthora megakarya]